MLSAGVALIGLKTRLVLAGIGGANQYLLDKGIGEFLVEKHLTVPPLAIPGSEVILSAAAPDCLEDPFDELVNNYLAGAAMGPLIASRPFMNTTNTIWMLMGSAALANLFLARLLKHDVQRVLQMLKKS